MTPIPFTFLSQALGRVDDADREDAVRVISLSAMGYGTMEIARQMGITWRKVEQLRDAAGDAVIEEMSVAGFGEGETIRTLGVPTARVVPSCV